MRAFQLVALGVIAVATPSLFAGEDPTKRLNDAASVLQDMMHMSDKGIPQDLINQARCVAVVPGMKKAAFIVGGKYGKGFVMCRKHGGGWSAPGAISIEGGSFGLQIGGSEQDVVLIVKGEDGMRKLMQDKFTIGGEADAAAGPVGRDLTAQTDAQLHAEILSYSRSRGLFAGLSLNGATLHQDTAADHDLYGRDIDNKEILTGEIATPAAAARLVRVLTRDSAHRG